MENIIGVLTNRLKLIAIIGILAGLVLSVISADRLTAHELPQSLVSKELEGAVSLAIQNQGRGYYNGEFLTEGHRILACEEKEGKTTVYMLASVSWFGFENGVFTAISGSGSIPTLLTFTRNGLGEYSLLEYKEPDDGVYLSNSVKKLFPPQFWNTVLNAQDKYQELAKQQESKAKAYLNSIGRVAPVHAGYVPKELVKIDVGASNKLFADLTRYDTFLNHCPFWLGSRERIENGNRLIYTTSQTKTADGYDLVVFKKQTEQGKVVEERKYKIVGREPQRIE